MQTPTDTSLYAPHYSSTTMEYFAVSMFESMESTYSSTVTQKGHEYEEEYVVDGPHTAPPSYISISQASNINLDETLLIKVSIAFLGMFLCCCLLLLIACAKSKNATTPGSTSKVAFQFKTKHIDKNDGTYDHNQTSPDLPEQKSISSLIKNYLFSQSIEVHANPNPSSNPDKTPPPSASMKINHAYPPMPKLSLQPANSNSSTFAVNTYSPRPPLSLQPVNSNSCSTIPVNVYPPIVRPKLSLQPANSNSSTISVNMHNTGLSMDVDFINTGKLERYQSESITASNEHRNIYDIDRAKHVELDMAKVASTDTIFEQMRNTGLSIVIDDQEEQIDHVITPQYYDDTPLHQIPDPQYSVKQSSPDIVHPPIMDIEGTPSPLYRHEGTISFEDSQSQSGELGERVNEIRALKNNGYYGQEEYSEY